jgi:hypothetical protein
MQQDWPAQRTCRRRVFRVVLAIACALAACNTPTWVVLRPKCSDGDGSADRANCGDTGVPQQVSCKTSADCAEGSVCEGGNCVPCAASVASKCPEQCPWSWKAQPLKRNGCAQCECAPASACQSDGDCGAGQQCYRGQLCQDGCVELGCCFGNFCSQPGCEDSPALSCSVVGCADGTCAGDTTCEPAACKCDGKAFECAPNCANAVCKL